jgi:cell division protein FtsI (penicillin-binding protein 3)
MEVATGKIKAMANLGLQSDGAYWEDMNYAIRATEPGSTFKLATMLSLLEDKKVTLDNTVDLGGGSWKIAGRTVFDSEPHADKTFTVKEAFELSSNVGMAKLAVAHYSNNPNQFISHLRALHLDKPTGVDLAGEAIPVVINPKSRTWSATALPWMAFGYEVLVTPLQTLTLYNAVANNGRMMKPYLVSAVQESGSTLRENQPTAIMEKICSDETLKRLQECLTGVCNDPEGTGTLTFKGSFYKVAGKTGTALMANGSHGYAEHIYQSTFVGYFPANAPKYTCIVVIKNKPFAKKYYGAAVAAPVFKEVADRLMSSEPTPETNPLLTRDSSRFYNAGNTHDIKLVEQTLGAPYADSTGKSEYSRLYASNMGGEPVLNRHVVLRQTVPDVKGMGLKDALYLLESLDLHVNVKGSGKVRSQNPGPGSALQKKETIFIQLD